jgi:hypothetical protein
MSIAISPINNQAACDELHDKLAGDYKTVHPETIVIPDERLREIDPKTIPGLAESIKEVGQISPIGLKRIAGTSNYRVVYGARRTLAIQSLWKDAMAKASDPNKDNDVHRFGSVHAIVYRNETDDETCKELEARENLDRQELTKREKLAHTLDVAAMVKRRHDSNKQMQEYSLNGRIPKEGSPITVPVRRDTAAALGVSPYTVRDRIDDAKVLTGNHDLNIETNSPEEIEGAAKAVRSAPPITKDNPSPGRIRTRRVSFSPTLFPSDAPAFAAYIKKRHPEHFTLDQIRAFRDALIELVEDLETAPEKTLSDKFIVKIGQGEWTFPEKNDSQETAP